MSINSVINSTLTGLFTTQSALKTTSNNISNVNTEGYARQVVETESIVVGGAGGGVRIAEVTRIIDEYLEAARFIAESNASGSQVSREIHDRLQGLLGSPDSDSHLTARIDDVFSNLSELTINSGSNIVREGVLASIEQFTQEVRRLADGIQQLRGGVNQKVFEQVEIANNALDRLAELNPLVVKHKAIGGDVTGLQTQISQALNDLSQVMDIKVETLDTGAIVVSTTSGVVLLDRSKRELEYLGPGTVSAETRFPSVQVHRLDPGSGERIGTPVDLDGDLQSGTLRSLIDLRDDDLRNLSLSLGEMAGQFSDQMNAVHNQFSSVPAPNQLSGHMTHIQGSHAVKFTGQVTFSVVDPDTKLVSKTTVDFDGAPPATYTDLVNQVNAGLGGAATLSLVNGVMTLTSANPANGVVISDDDASPSNLGGKGFSHFFGMNDLIEATVQASYNTGLDGTEAHALDAGGAATLEVRDANNRILTTYTYNVAGASYNDILADLNNVAALGQYYSFSLDSNGALVSTIKPGYDNLHISTISDTTSVAGSGMTLTQVFGIGDKYTAGRTSNMQIVERVRNNPANLALSKMDQTVAVGAVTMGKGDQRGAIAFENLQETLVNYESAGGLSAMSVSLSQYTAAILSHAGFMGQRAQDREADAKATLDDVNIRTSEISGVNLDEELTNMVILQNSFNASARLISTADEIMETILQLGR